MSTTVLSAARTHFLPPSWRFPCHTTILRHPWSQPLSLLIFATACLPSTLPLTDHPKAMRGPAGTAPSTARPPRPAWVITDLGAVDEDLGIIKSGKEADVHVVRRWVPASDNADVVNGSYMAAKRFRDSDHRMFHRDAGYLEGRRVRRSREMRAMTRRTAFGKEMISAQWANAEFNALGELWGAGLPVPYPVQMSGTEVLMEFIGDGAQAAPRLAQTRPDPALLADLFEQLRVTMSELALRGWTHGDLSPYNVLLHGDRLVIIDWPQIVDVIGNPPRP